MPAIGIFLAATLQVSAGDDRSGAAKFAVGEASGSSTQDKINLSAASLNYS
jgi:hypothetical protein